MLKNIRSRWIAFLIIVIMTLSIAVLPSMVQASMYYMIDAESATIKSNNDLVDNGVTHWGYEQGNYDSLVFNSDYKRAGNYSIKFKLNPTTSGSNRMELYMEHFNTTSYPQLYHSDAYGSEKSLGFSIYLPSNFTTPQNWTVLYQVTQSDQSIGPSPNIELAITTSGYIVLNLRHGHGGQGNSGTIMTQHTLFTLSSAKGKWIDYLWNYKLSMGTDGWIKAYTKLGTDSTYTKRIHYTGQTGYWACVTDEIVIKGGLYRGAQNNTMYLYQDEVRYGQTAADVKIPGSQFPSSGYRIVNRWSGYSLTVSGGSTADNANIIQSGYNGYDYQKFTLSPNGSYYNLLAVHSGKAIDELTQNLYQNAQQRTLQTGYWSQQWQRIDRGGGYYSFVNRWTGYALTAPNTSSGTVMNQNTYNTSYYSQQWQLISQ